MSGSGFLSLIPRYQAFLLDLWGVVHDGTALYPGVKEALLALRAAQKQVIFLSNAPRRAAQVTRVLDALGIDRALYLATISSGEVGYAYLQQLSPRPLYFIGPDRDAPVVEHLPHRRVADLKDAKVLVVAGYEDGQTDDRAFDDILKKACALGLPMLCLNPDLEVVKQTGERQPCAGIMAVRYERMGGGVTYFGKPYPAVYETCLARLSGTAKARILAVGDSLLTDIRGANTIGIDSALVTGGILKATLGEPADAGKLEALCRETGAQPTYVISALGG